MNKGGRPKMKYDLLPVASFRLADEHLTCLDRLDRDGEGRSAALRRLLEGLDRQRVIPLRDVAPGGIFPNVAVGAAK